jgi:hypothetical protein
VLAIVTISPRSDSCRNLFSSLGAFFSWTEMSTRVETSVIDLRTSSSRVRLLPQWVAKEPGRSTSETGTRQT